MGVGPALAFLPTGIQIADRASIARLPPSSEFLAPGVARLRQPRMPRSAAPDAAFRSPGCRVPPPSPPRSAVSPPPASQFRARTRYSLTPDAIVLIVRLTGTATTTELRMDPRMDPTEILTSLSTP